MNTPDIMEYFKGDAAVINLDAVTRGLPERMDEWAKLIRANVCISFNVNENQAGMLILGKKKSDQEFTHEEMDYFPTIASQAALAMRNAGLIETLVREREEKIDALHQAKRVHYAEILAHEVKNAVQAIDMPARFYCDQIAPKLQLIYDKFMVDKLPNGVAKQYLKICNSIIDMGKGIQQRAKKIRVITKTAQYHLSSDESIFEEIYIKMLWEDAVTESAVKGVIFQFKGPDDRDFYVYGNPVMIQRVFINLIRNAYDAMSGQQEKKIRLDCRYEEINAAKVTYFEFKDNGPGISASLKDKVFEKGFSTKGKPRGEDIMASGSGYGLYMCKEIIESIHKGSIWIAAQEEEGASICFWLPMRTEKADQAASAAAENPIDKQNM